MSEQRLSEEEQRNVRAAMQWPDLYAVPGFEAERLGALYAARCDVLTPLDCFYYSKESDPDGKGYWLAFEEAYAALCVRRVVTVAAVLARGDRVAIEASIEATLLDGEVRRLPFAVFFKFREGKVVEDHSYMGELRALPDSYESEAVRSVLDGLRERYEQ